MTLFLGFAGGFAACWYMKDTLLKWYHGAANLAAKLEAKAAALKSLL